MGYVGIGGWWRFHSFIRSDGNSYLYAYLTDTYRVSLGTLSATHIINRVSTGNLKLNLNRHQPTNQHDALRRLAVLYSAAAGPLSFTVPHTASHWSTQQHSSVSTSGQYSFIVKTSRTLVPRSGLLLLMHPCRVGLQPKHEPRHRCRHF